ncbi:MAG: amino acid ABC transporter substrate-binding protein [Chloroflexi bacterium]|nr:amino acid ABC transporter substrate-binding protein [Chloroflexota bacterium]
MSDTHHGTRTTHYVILALVMAFAALWLAPEVVAWLNRGEDEAWARVQRSGVIRFAIDPSYMPFDGLGSQGDFYGIDVEIANEVARRSGLRAEFVIAGQDSLYDVLAVGQADATISALIVNPIIDYVWDYSTPYFDAGQVLIKPLRSSTTSEVSIAVEFGSDGDAAARHLARRQANIQVKQFPTATEALQAVSTGQVDTAIVDAVSARQLIPKAYPQLQVGEYVTHDPLAIAVWGESAQLLTAINRALVEMQHDGTTQRIIDAWMAK